VNWKLAKLGGGYSKWSLVGRAGGRARRVKRRRLALEAGDRERTGHWQSASARWHFEKLGDTLKSRDKSRV
jgi:hypothetical protein